ncbi:hypothetical protein E3J59_02810 [Candidatus Aerophobetes bacterium]|uniref:Tyr recombinase domain-containing protein n=1 Tax=Aerophobetes bacterium TaxID=2030807 RepID=A0A523UW96_UNCAE|nr:MAG: hypothetical protein E3J59_02810 [Candidatus Aerophobetes bacterium]
MLPVETTVKKVTHKARISKPASPHALRHTLSVNCIKKGISTRALQTMGKGSKSNRGGAECLKRVISSSIWMNIIPKRKHN